MADVAFKTSGSTGAAKTIVRSEASLAADAQNLVTAFPEVWARKPPVIASVRPDHMFGALWCVRAPAYAGSSVDPRVVLSVEELLAAKRSYGSFLFVTTPSFLEKALVHPDFPLLKGAFHAIVTSGSPLRGETSRALRETVGVTPLEIYGSTEAGTVAWRRQASDDVATLVPGVTARRRADGRLEVDSPFAMTRPFVMDDLVAFTDARRFRILGRADRRVKVLEQYVSLESVESALAAQPWVSSVRVEPFGEGVTRLGALLVLSAQGRARVAAEGTQPFASVLRTALQAVLPARAIPRRFRFVRELPVNAQGKVTAVAARAALGAWCREPVALTWEQTAEFLRTDLVFPSDMECFKGHFPQAPVLPGVAQLFFVRHYARTAFPDWPETATFKRLKFQKIIVPFERVTLTIVRKGAETFDFALVGPNGPCASGLVERTSSL